MSQNDVPMEVGSHFRRGCRIYVISKTGEYYQLININTGNRLLYNTFSFLPTINEIKNKTREKHPTGRIYINISTYEGVLEPAPEEYIEEVKF